METQVAESIAPQIEIPQVQVEAPVVEAPAVEDLVTRVSKVETVIKPNIEEPTFDLKDIQNIKDPQAKEQALKAYKSFQRGFGEKFEELANLRKELNEIKNKNTQWTPERIRQELNKPDFIQASQEVLQEQNPQNSGMNETEWSSLTSNEKKQWQVMQQELTSLKQQNQNQQILQNFKQQDEQLKTRYANYDSNAVDIITSELLSGKRQATREDLHKAIDYDNAVMRAYELGKQDGSSNLTEKLNASSYDGITTGKPATDVPIANKNESTTSFFGRLVENNIRKQQAQR
jgi:hypothetical protein